MRLNMKRGSGRWDALHFCTIRLGDGLTKSMGESCRLKMRFDISGDRPPISDSNEIIIIQKQGPLPARMVCTDVARRARSKPAFGFDRYGAQCGHQVTRGRLKSGAIVDDNYFLTVGQGISDSLQRLCQ